MNIEQTSESQISVNGITHHIDTIYGEPDIIGPKGYYVYIEDEHQNANPTFYTYQKVFEVFNAYKEALQNGNYIPFRQFESNLNQQS